MIEIPNEELRISHIPEPGAEWSAIWLFALSFNGYKHHGGHAACAEIANCRKNDTLTELRTCLFFEQRRWRHFGEDPDNTSGEYIRELLVQIKHKLMED